MEELEINKMRHQWDMVKHTVTHPDGLFAVMDFNADGLFNKIERLQKERDALAAENTHLRAALANSDQPCVYCSLSKEDWSKCADGFPGCARGDDAMGCPELLDDAMGEGEE